MSSGFFSIMLVTGGKHCDCYVGWLSACHSVCIGKQNASYKLGFGRDVVTIDMSDILNVAVAAYCTAPPPLLY